MQGVEQIIPHPSIVRERLARNIQEGRVLRSLLRLSVRAVEAQSRPVSAAGGATTSQHSGQGGSSPS